jgi:hypothetical protein
VQDWRHGTSITPEARDRGPRKRERERERERKPDLACGPAIAGPQVIEVRCHRSGRMGGQDLRRLPSYLGGNWEPGRLGGPGVRGAVAV